MIEKALETGTFLEINSQPDRLDLTDVHARAAREAGLKLVIDSDGHQLSALDYVELGVGQARRAWLTKARRRQHAHVEADRAAAKEAPVTRAVVFDLWETLVEWPVAEADVLKQRLAARSACSTGRVRAALARAATERRRRGPLADSYRAARDSGRARRRARRGRVTSLHGARSACARGARETLAELRARGLKLGLISVCSEDVPAAWPETELAGPLRCRDVLRRPAA